MAFVYLLYSLKDRKQYIGSTVNLELRVLQHNRGKVFSTRGRRPLVLKGYQTFNTVEEAAMYEKKYKKSHGVLERAIKAGTFKLINIGV